MKLACNLGKMKCETIQSDKPLSLLSLNDLIPPHMSAPRIRTTLLSLVLLLLCVKGFSQCGDYAEKSCIPSLAPYKPTGQFYGKNVAAGDSLTIIQSFSPDHDYRLLVCYDTLAFKGVYFEMKTVRRELVHSSKEAGEDVHDFNVPSAQNMLIKVYVPAQQEEGLKGEGCVSFLVGFRE